MKRRKFRRPNATGRNDDEERYMKLSYPMLNSPAWRSLTGNATKVWLEIRTRYNGGNNGKLRLSLDEASRILSIGKATARRAFLELESKGFLILTRRGQWHGRLASEYACTETRVNGENPTNDWKRWQPRKQSLGSATDHIEGLTGPPQNRNIGNGTGTEPVRPILRH
jgi:hypothetical protein